MPKPKLRVVATQDDADQFLTEHREFPASAEWSGAHTLPRRQWLYGRHRQAGTVCATIGDDTPERISELIRNAH